MNTLNATLGIVIIEADTIIIAVNKEALLKHLRPAFKSRKRWNT